MSAQPIVEPADAPIDGTLFRELQVFIADSLNLGQPAAHAASRVFMARYRAASADNLRTLAAAEPRLQRRPHDARLP